MRNQKMAMEYAEKLANLIQQKLPEIDCQLKCEFCDHNNNCSAHKSIELYINKYLRKQSEFIKLEPPYYVYEGSGYTNEWSYPLLGTTAHPDAAVLRPFRCAFEFDREPMRADGPRSHFKYALMKAAAHVISGHYDACVLVYILNNPENKKLYLEGNYDEEGRTKQLLDLLGKYGLFVCMVPAYS